MTIHEIKNLPKEEFMKRPNATEELYNALHNAKSGWIKVTHADTGEVHDGYTDAFGEGISVHMSTPSEWYYTSIIQEINWEEHWFKTLNSIYYFEFQDEEELQKKRDEITNKIMKMIYESKSN